MVCLFKRNGRKIYRKQNWTSLEHFCPIFFSFKSKAWKFWIFSLVFLKVKDHPNIGKRRRKVTQKLRDDGVDLKWHGRWTGCLFFCVGRRFGCRSVCVICDRVFHLPYVTSSTFWMVWRPGEQFLTAEPTTTTRSPPPPGCTSGCLIGHNTDNICPKVALLLRFNR